MASEHSHAVPAIGLLVPALVSVLVAALTALCVGAAGDFNPHGIFGAGLMLFVFTFLVGGAFEAFFVPIAVFRLARTPLLRTLHNSAAAAIRGPYLLAVVVLGAYLLLVRA